MKFKPDLPMNAHKITVMKVDLPSSIVGNIDHVSLCQHQALNLVMGQRYSHVHIPVEPLLK
jgi:hypothetical protein